MQTRDFIPYLEEFALAAVRHSEAATLGAHDSFRPERGLRMLDRREYEPGDPVTTIDFVASFVSGRFIKRRYRESKMHPVALAVDCSASMTFGTQRFTKKEKALLAASMVATAALSQRDPVGTFSLGLRNEQWVSPSMEDDILLRLQAMHAASSGDAPDVSWGRRMSGFCEIPYLVVLCSDFLNIAFWEAALPPLAARHDCLAIVVQDRAESIDETGAWLMPAAGVLHCAAPGGRRVIDVGDERHRASITERLTQLHRRQQALFRRHGVDAVRFWDIDVLLRQILVLMSIRENETYRE